MNDPRRILLASHWHAGELEMQRAAGVQEMLAGLDVRVFRNSLTPPQQSFYTQLSYAVVGAVDEHGAAWATVIEGKPGFLVPHGALALDVKHSREKADPVDECLDDGAAIALLGIDLATRRRLRLNGHITRGDSDSFRIEVEQSFGNCPKYIQARKVTSGYTGSVLTQHSAPEYLLTVDDAARQLITDADTFFVASYVDRAPSERQVDVSHRGGLPGFVRVGTDGALMIPDFPGNKFYNTLGNFALNPTAGLCFADFTTGELLHLRGDVHLERPEDAHFDEAEQFWRFVPRVLLRRPAALQQRWSLLAGGWSPDSLAMGHWRDR